MNNLIKNGKALSFNGRVLKRRLDDYIAFWRFNGNYVEESGTYTTTPYQGPLKDPITFGPGKFNECINFIKSESQSANTNLFTKPIMGGINKYTISFWLKAGPFSGGEGNHGFLDGNSYLGFLLRNFNDTDDNYIHWYRDATTLSPNAIKDYDWEPYVDGNWNHIVLRYGFEDSSTGNIWLNGVKKITKTDFTSNDDDYPENIFKMGVGLNYGTSSMDNLRIYDYAITDTKIAELYNE